MQTTVFLSLGSNIGDRLSYLKRAVDMLQEHLEVVKVSSIYETAPWGKTDQEGFLNLVVQARTELSPFELLSVVQHVENALDRVREERWGPRTMDVDILFYGQQAIQEPRLGLNIPHARLWERAFVLVPLLEIAPQFRFRGRSIREALQEVQDQVVDKYEEAEEHPL